MRPLLIVDGYNVIGAWKDVIKHAWTMDEARDRLMHHLMDYSGYTGEEVVLVFDGYKSDRAVETEEKHGLVTLVFTRHGETADSYIERLVVQTPKYRTVRVATSDGHEQSMVLGAGGIRLTSRELLREMRQSRAAGFASQTVGVSISRNQLSDGLPRDVKDALERLRRGQ